MINVPKAWIDRLSRGEMPTPYILMETGMGWRAFGARHLDDMEAVYLAAGVDLLADGTYYANGEVYADGALSVSLLSYDARVISFGNISRTLRPKAQDLLVGYTSKEKAIMSVVLDNTDKYFNDLMRIEPILNKRLQVILGYAEDGYDYHYALFNGLITQVRFDSRNKFVVEAEESITELTEYHYLNRAGRFANPLNTNDRLPIVYGDCSDGANWRAPCIDTVNGVYCFAGHSVLSVVEGNDIRVFVNGLEINPIDYVFDESDATYENMATITFASSQGDLEEIDVVVGGMGKADAYGLITNIMDIIQDLLEEEIVWEGSFDTTKKAMSTALFTGKSYEAAGVIIEDFDIWDKLRDMASSFLGMVYLNSENKLVIDLDLRKWNNEFFQESNTKAVIQTYKTEVAEAKKSLDSVANHIPASYGYDYYKREFRHHTDDSDYQDDQSQVQYGDMNPIYSGYGDRNPGVYQFYWSRVKADVNDMQDILVDRLSNPIWQLKVKDVSGLNLFVEMGDTVQYSAEGYYDNDGEEMLNEIFFVLGTDIDLDTFGINWTLIDTTNYRSLADIYYDGTYYYNGAITYGRDRDREIH